LSKIAEVVMEVRDLPQIFQDTLMFMGPVGAEGDVLVATERVELMPEMVEARKVQE
jgi:hypothetical protein